MVAVSPAPTTRPEGDRSAHLWHRPAAPGIARHDGGTQSQGGAQRPRQRHLTQVRGKRREDRGEESTAGSRHTTTSSPSARWSSAPIRGRRYSCGREHSTTHTTRQPGGKAKHSTDGTQCQWFGIPASPRTSARGSHETDNGGASGGDRRGGNQTQCSSQMVSRVRPRSRPVWGGRAGACSQPGKGWPHGRDGPTVSWWSGAVERWSAGGPGAGWARGRRGGVAGVLGEWGRAE